MKYLYRENARTAHLWDGQDTVCRMYSTNGIWNHSAFGVADSPGGRTICQNCLHHALALGLIADENTLRDERQAQMELVLQAKMMQ